MNFTSIDFHSNSESTFSSDETRGSFPRERFDGNHQGIFAAREKPENYTTVDIFQRLRGLLRFPHTVKSVRFPKWSAVFRCLSILSKKFSSLDKRIEGLSNFSIQTIGYYRSRNVSQATVAAINDHLLIVIDVEHLLREHQRDEELKRCNTVDRFRYYNHSRDYSASYSIVYLFRIGSQKRLSNAARGLRKIDE